MMNLVSNELLETSRKEPFSILLESRKLLYKME